MAQIRCHHQKEEKDYIKAKRGKKENFQRKEEKSQGKKHWLHEKKKWGYQGQRTFFHLLLPRVGHSHLKKWDMWISRQVSLRRKKMLEIATPSFSFLCMTLLKLGSIPSYFIASKTISLVPHCCCGVDCLIGPPQTLQWFFSFVLLIALKAIGSCIVRPLPDSPEQLLLQVAPEHLPSFSS